MRHFKTLFPHGGYRHTFWGPTPVGRLYLVVSDAGLHGLLCDPDMDLEQNRTAFHSLTDHPDHFIIKQVMDQLDEYFRGERRSFSVPLVLDGTDFQKQAWQGLLKIPYGQTRSYQEQAEMLGDKRKARAVGTANGWNPITIIIPCHRVIGANGSLGGFRGGLPLKQFLLEHEAAHQS